jgi:hypothetical protein
MSKIEGINNKVYPIPQLLEDVANAPGSPITVGLFIGLDETGTPRLWCANMTDERLAFLCKCLEGWVFQQFFGG